MQEIYTHAGTIYESPDGGKTVFARKIGSTQRQLAAENLKPRIDPLESNQYPLTMADYFYIQRLAKTNPALREAVDNLIVLYELVKTNG